MGILYKYRSLDNWKYILDIILNKRLHLSQYKELNDPMEGFYYYTDDIDRRLQEKIRNKKLEYKICSLSKKYDNTLMWSHYANSHKGIVLGVDIKNKNKLKKVDYVEDLVLDSSNVAKSTRETDVAKTILSKKLTPWEYEEEVRILSRDKYIEVDIKELYLGCEINDIDEKLIKKLTSKYLSIEVLKKLKKHELK